MSLYEALFLRGSAVILAYHKIVPRSQMKPGEEGMCVTPETFEMQMNHLVRHCRVMALDDLVETLNAGRPIAPRTCVLTFDDGTRDNFETAFPILERLHLPATFFVITSRLNANAQDCFNSEEAKTILDRGGGIGGHSRTHRKLTRTTDQELDEELRLPLRQIREMLGVESPAFAYPFGDFDERVKIRVREAGYRCAVTTRPGFVKSGADLFSLPRIHIDNDSTADIPSFATRLLRVPRSAVTQKP